MTLSIDNCIKKIIEIDTAMKKGEEIHREEQPKSLSVVWTNLETYQEWRIGYNILRAVAKQRKNDPRAVWIMIFITGHMNATAIMDEIDKLENLKAFW